MTISALRSDTTTWDPGGKGGLAEDKILQLQMPGQMKTKQWTWNQERNLIAIRTWQLLDGMHIFFNFR